MGTIVPRGGSYRAVVRKKGHTATKTFTKVALARSWIAETEAAVERRQVFSKGCKLGGLVDRYRIEIVEKRRGLVPAQFNLMWLAREVGKVDLSECTKAWWVKLVSAWDVAPASRKKYLDELQSTLNAAQNLWDYTVDWKSFKQAVAILKATKIIGPANTRTRRLMTGELEAIKKHMGSSLPMNDIIDFTLVLGLRVNELCRIRWADLDEENKMLLVRDRKHPKKKFNNNVPLIGTSLEIIQRQPRTDAEGRALKLIFPYAKTSVSAAFKRATIAAACDDLSFHDLRHEAISRLFELGFGIPEVVLISGHTDWKSLQIYTNLKPESLHSGPMGNISRAA